MGGQRNLDPDAILHVRWSLEDALDASVQYLNFLRNTVSCQTGRISTEQEGCGAVFLAKQEGAMFLSKQEANGRFCLP